MQDINYISVSNKEPLWYPNVENSGSIRGDVYVSNETTQDEKNYRIQHVLVTPGTPQAGEKVLVSVTWESITADTDPASVEIWLDNSIAYKGILYFPYPGVITRTYEISAGKSIGTHQVEVRIGSNLIDRTEEWDSRVSVIEVLPRDAIFKINSLQIPKNQFYEYEDFDVDISIESITPNAEAAVLELVHDGSIIATDQIAFSEQSGQVVQKQYPINTGSSLGLKKLEARVHPLEDQGHESGDTVTASIFVNPLESDGSVAVTPKSVVIHIGDCLDLNYTSEGQVDGEVNWFSSNPEVVWVDSKGRIYSGHKYGTALIAATCGQATAGICQVQLAPAANEVWGNDEPIQVKPGLKTVLTCNWSPESTSEVVEWTSLNPAVATVDTSGTVTAIQQGRTHISATTQTTEGIQTVYFYLVVEQTVYSMWIDQPVKVVRQGHTLPLKLTTSPDNAPKVTISWESSDESVATINHKGEIYGVSPGICRITATRGDKTVSHEWYIIDDRDESLEITELSVHEEKDMNFLATAICYNHTDKDTVAYIEWLVNGEPSSYYAFSIAAYSHQYGYEYFSFNQDGEYEVEARVNWSCPESNENTKNRKSVKVYVDSSHLEPTSIYCNFPNSIEVDEMYRLQPYVDGIIPYNAVFDIMSSNPEIITATNMDNGGNAIYYLQGMQAGQATITVKLPQYNLESSFVATVADSACNETPWLSSCTHGLFRIKSVLDNAYLCSTAPETFTSGSNVYVDYRQTSSRNYLTYEQVADMQTKPMELPFDQLNSRFLFRCVPNTLFVEQIDAQFLVSGNLVYLVSNNGIYTNNYQFKFEKADGYENAYRIRCVGMAIGGKPVYLTRAVSRISTAIINESDPNSQLWIVMPYTGAALYGEDHLVSEALFRKRNSQYYTQLTRDGNDYTVSVGGIPANPSQPDGKAGFHPYSGMIHTTQNLNLNYISTAQGTITDALIKLYTAVFDCEPEEIADSNLYFNLFGMLQPDEKGFHLGVDLTYGGGRIVKSAHHGIVINSPADSADGTVAIYDESKKVTYLYVHLTDISYEQGQIISEGDELGRESNRGSDTGSPHLHFEVRKGKAQTRYQAKASYGTVFPMTRDERSEIDPISGQIVTINGRVLFPYDYM